MPPVYRPLRLLVTEVNRGEYLPGVGIAGAGLEAGLLYEPQERERY